MRIAKALRLFLSALVTLIILATFGDANSQERNIIISADFDQSTDGFTFVPDAFLGTNKPDDAQGQHSGTEGFMGGGLKMILGVGNGKQEDRISGGWERIFFLTEKTWVELSFKYNLTQLANSEKGSISQVLASIDGTLLGTEGDAEEGHRYVQELARRDSSTRELKTNWQEFRIVLGNVAPGEHKLRIGGFNKQEKPQDARKANTAAFTQTTLSSVSSVPSVLLLDDVVMMQSSGEELTATSSLRIAIPSPTATSLGKFGEIPVSLYTGTPNISIPLYEVKSRDLTLPITSSYHASGIKVEERGGWVVWVGRLVQAAPLPERYVGCRMRSPQDTTSLPMTLTMRIYGMNSRGR